MKIMTSAGRPKIDLLGQRFSHLLVVASVIGGWLCRCDCGTEKVIFGAHLREGRTKSCGCATSELLSQPRTHGKRHTRAWKIWSGIIQRCNNPRHARYADYGGRGIGVCDSWLKFEGFYADMGDPPKDSSIDRIDNELGYNKANCQWASKTQQARNTRVSRMFEIDGVSKSLAEWCEIYGVIYTTAHSRISRGWSIERALGVTA